MFSNGDKQQFKKLWTKLQKHINKDKVMEDVCARRAEHEGRPEDLILLALAESNGSTAEQFIEKYQEYS